MKVNLKDFDWEKKVAKIQATKSNEWITKLNQNYQKPNVFKATVSLGVTTNQDSVWCQNLGNFPFVLSMYEHLDI